MDKISNDTLRSRIAEMYDFSFPRAAYLINTTQEQSESHHLKTMDLFFIFDFEAQLNSKAQPKSMIDYDLLFDKAHFLSNLKYRNGYAINAIYRLESIILQITYLFPYLYAFRNMNSFKKNN